MSGPQPSSYPRMGSGRDTVAHVDRVGPQSATMTLASGELSAPLRDAVAQGRAAWHGVDVPDDAFASYVLARAAGSDPSELQVRDLYLACACARGDADAIAVFERDFVAPLAAIVARSGSPRHVGAEVTQRLRERLLVGEGGRLPRITEYAGKGSLAGWLRVAAVREASKVQRHERVHASLRPDVPPPAATPEEAAIRARYGEAFNTAFREAFKSLPAEERVVLRLHFAEGLNLDGLATALGFSRATAGRRLLGARTRLRDETMRLLGERLAAPPEEIASVLAVLRSRLEITFGDLVSAA
jgi:RNA polymerase sigma-70 factor (ECF subfamily)